MTGDELSPQREERLVGEMLRERGGIDPSRLGPVIDLAALGLVNSAWRNTCVEDWHAEGRLHDGDMMRVSSHMSWRARQILRRWMTEVGLAARAGGVIRAGLTWWTGCCWPLTIRPTSTGDRTGSSGNDCRPSRPS